MQSVSAAFTAEERDTTRKIVQNTQVSWHKQSTLGNRTFTIGTSLIGGNDIIGANPGAIGSPGNYKYFDESQYVTGLSWERGINMPTGGLTKALAEVRLDNTSGRFTPRYMGGNSELYTSAYLPRRPLTLSAGFNLGTDITIQQFAGITTEPATIDMRNREVKIRGADYVDFFQGRYLDQEVMFTGQRTDEVLTTLFENLGMNTAQYDLDTGINIIPFGLFPKDSRFSDIIAKMVEAENARLYQDESGILKFENRQHWDSSPYTQIQRIITTGQVINAEAPNDDHLINVVEVKGQQIVKQPLQVIMNFNTATLINANSTADIFFDYIDPVLEVIQPTLAGADSYYEANILPDAQGDNVSSSVSVKSMSNFATTSKIIFQNNSSINLYLTKVVISGRLAKKVADIYTRLQDDSSVTAYEERSLVIENQFIQNADWANSLAQMLLNDYSSPENIQRLTIRAIPELQLGDLISWQGRYWRVFDIKSTLNPAAGFIQDLTLLQRTITSYFRIGISTIGGSDQVAP